MAIEPIYGMYVHDEETDTDGIAKFSSEELEDIRVGADGVTYANAGDAVRGQAFRPVDENITNTIKGAFIKTSSNTATLDAPTVNSSFCYQIIPATKDDVFYVTGYGGESPRLFAWVRNDGTVISRDAQNTNRAHYKITAPEDCSLVVNFAMDNSYSIYKRMSFAETVEHINASFEQEIKLDTLSEVANPLPFDSGVNLSGIYADLSVIKAYPNVSVNGSFPGYGLQVIEAKKGDVFYITGSGGGSARLYALVDKDTGYIISRAPLDATLSNYKLEVKEDCYLVCHLHRAYPYSLQVVDRVNAVIPKIKSNIDTFDFELLRYLYPFGYGINGIYDTPAIPALTGITQQGAGKLDYFYGLYDALVSDYPDYVSKVDCDTDSGITRPSYMDDYPIYMYRFLPPFTRGNDPANSPSVQDKIKVFITTGTHPEYVSIFDCYQTMRLICEEWENDENLEALRWDVEFYVMPCSGSWGVENFSRKNYNGVDLNRNASASDWQLAGAGTDEYSGSAPASEYETKVFEYYLKKIKPLIYIDHHNFTASADLWYAQSRQQRVIDVMAQHISAMTRSVKRRYPETFPPLSNNILFGFCQSTVAHGARATLASDMGIISCIFETCESLEYANGEFTGNVVESWTSKVTTVATDAFLNFLLRLLKE